MGDLVKKYHNNGNGSYFSFGTQKTLPTDVHQQIYDDNYSFNADYFDELTQKGEVEKALRYARCFHYDDVNDEATFQQAIFQYEQNMAEAKEYYKQVKNSKNGYKIDGYNQFINNENRDPNNQFNQELMTAKDKIGSTFNADGTIKDKAEALEISFGPDKVEGWFGIKRDNENNFNQFLTNLNLTSNELSAAGVEVIPTKDGGTTIRFAKNNKLADKMLYCIPQNNDDGMNFLEGKSDRNPNRQPRSQNMIWERPDVNVGVKGLKRDENGEYIEIFESKQNRYTDRDTSGGGREKNENDTYIQLTNFRDIINDAKNETKNFNAAYEKQKVQSNLIISRVTSDALEENYNNMETGQLKFSVGERIKNDLITELESLVSASGYKEMYSNAFDEDGDFRDTDNTDEVLREINSRDYSKLMDYLTTSKDVKFNAGYLNGQSGLVVTIGATANKGDDATNNDRIKYKRIQIFIPGFAQDKVNAMLANDPTIQAQQRCATMKNTEYRYVANDGISSVTYSDANGSYMYENIKTGEKIKISQESAERIMIADNAAERITNDILRNQSMTDDKIHNNMETNILKNALLYTKMMFDEDETDFKKPDGSSVSSNELFKYNNNGELIVNPNILMKKVNLKPAQMISLIFNQVNSLIKDRYSDDTKKSIADYMQQRMFNTNNK